jgi:lysophospholipase L1-like esterase
MRPVFQAFEHYRAVRDRSTVEILPASDGIHPNQAGQIPVSKLPTSRIAELVRR